MPAVSTKRHSESSSCTSESTGSTVVPAMSETTARSSPEILFSSDDLPTFGLPTMATRRGPCGCALARGTSGKALTTSSMTSALPRPCSADVGCGSPRPRAQNSATSPSCESDSNLLAVRITGCSARCRRRAIISSVAVTPTLVSTTMMITSAVSIAASAWRAMDALRPLASGSQPPVSCTQKRRPPQSPR